MEEILSPKELSKILKVSLVCVYKWAERGVIPSYKLEGVVRFSRDDVLDFLQNRKKVGQNKVNVARNP
ncbi:MAG: helix-turn-helix domain-containing protein [Candidatus Hodarchaeota archaeon]